MDDQAAQRAWKLANSGHLAEALQVYGELLAEQRQRLGDAHPETLQTINDEATVHLRMRQFEPARQAAGYAAQKRAEVLGVEHPDTLRSSYLVGAVLHDEGETAAARRLLEGLLPLFRRVFGSTARETGEVVGELATLLRTAGESDAAAQLEATLRPRYDHTVPDTWTLTIGLGVQAARDGKVAEAETILRGVVEQAPPLPAASASFNLGQVLMLKPDADAALDAFRHAAETGDGEVAPMAFARIGALLHERGDLDEAAVAYHGAIDGDDGEPGMSSAIRLGALRRHQGDVAGARAAYTHATRAADPELRSIGALGLAEMLAESGDRTAARDAYQQIIDTAPERIAQLARQGLGQLGS
ncbi:MAG: hypothetical protein AUI14_24820 [Actinobacteria bacterium 13_2_20CM_2_71_6]|nr:MAG: hypothetical protein AUI14_24820 [Actinobacteria bacterium 13_2_20CM_2_71_6]